MLLKVVVTGPESSGKTSMAEHLSTFFEAPLAHEYSRIYLKELDHDYAEEDLINIAKGQLHLENRTMKDQDGLIICDTSLEVLKIWSEYKYQTCDPFITNTLKSCLPDAYLLMKPDLPWEPDPLRENPDDRDLLYGLYKKEIEQLGVPYYVIDGVGEIRFQKGESIVKKLLV